MSVPSSRVKNSENKVGNQIAVCPFQSLFNIMTTSSLLKELVLNATDFPNSRSNLNVTVTIIHVRTAVYFGRARTMPVLVQFCSLAETE